jgi:mannose-6-phosphate isomerase-like protein (cupin superfamily)
MIRLEGRIWGHYKVLYERSNLVIKEIVLNPGCGISYQRHFGRNESWSVIKGTLTVRKAPPYASFAYTTHTLEEGDVITVMPLEWHQAMNLTSEPVVFYEMQTGKCDEKDIERLSYYNEE